MQHGRVEHIHIASRRTAPMDARDSIDAIAGTGLADDRYGAGRGDPSKRRRPAMQITLIEAEAIDAVAREHDIQLSPGESRRNITTRGVALNPLVGQTFRVGPVTLRGVKLCHPCDHLEQLTGKPGLKDALANRGGLRAEILEGGTIRTGDVIRPDS